jgi:transforming growth factor-beta-induced protein
MKIKFAFVFTVLAMLLAACGPQATPAPTAEPESTPMPQPTAIPTEEPDMSQTIVDIAVEDGRFTTLVAAVQAAGLAETLSGDGPFTVFAPTDDAFAALPEETLDNLLLPENKQQLTDILLYHVVPGKVMAADVVGLDGQSAETALEDSSIDIKVDGDQVILNENVNIIITDIEATNGVIHIIDAVLLPQSDEAMSEGATAEKMDIVDTAAADGRFTTLVAAVQAAEMVETLKSEGPFTVFAPTDDAFAALPAGTLDSLLLPENKQQLTNILLYHVVPGNVMAADVVGLDGQSAETALSDQSISIKIDGDKVILNENVQVIITDIETSNGVIHVIDAVLLPAG